MAEKTIAVVGDTGTNVSGLIGTIQDTNAAEKFTIDDIKVALNGTIFLTEGGRNKPIIASRNFTYNDIPVAAQGDAVTGVTYTINPSILHEVTINE